MKSFNQYRKASRRFMTGALASWPLVAASGCSVYDDSLLGNSAVPLGGNAASAGVGSSVAGVGAQGDGANGGVASGGAGAVNAAGKAGESAEGGSAAGTPTGGSSAGSAGKGTGGSGGEPVTGPTETIDNMEDGDAEIDLAGPRNGYWYVGGDLTVGATTEPVSSAFMMTELGASERSEYAAHLKAVGFKDWGSVMGFNFIELLTKVKPYDGSAYCGIQFWGKAAAATTLRFRVPDINTHQNGEVCEIGGGVGKACFDHFGTSQSFTTAWKAFSVSFTDLAQTGTGYHAAGDKLKADQLMAVEWALPGTGKTYEIWIDDVDFIKCP